MTRNLSSRRALAFRFRPNVMVLEDRTAPASFQGIGFLPGDTLSEAIGISPDGSVVVGLSDGSTGGHAFRWTATGGMVGLGSIGGSYSVAGGVSADGSVVVGGSSNQPFRWTSATGMVGLGGTGNSSYASAFSVSADGGVIVGAMGNPPQAFRWTESGGLIGLGHIPGLTEFSLATSVTLDGTTVVGWSQGNGHYETFRWKAETGMVGLGTLGSAASSAYAISADGTTVVGDDGFMPTQKAYRWTASTGMVDLGHLSGSTTETQSYGVSGDGSVVVGHSAGQAFYWTQSGGLQSLQTLLASDLGLAADLSGWSLSAAYKCSVDGQSIIGWGTNPTGQTEAWVAHLGPTVPPPDDLDIVAVVNVGHQPGAPLGHQGNPLVVKQRSVLDGADPSSDRGLDAGCTMGMGGHIGPPLGGLVDRGPDGGLGKLHGPDIGAHGENGARGDHLDEVGSPAQDLCHPSPNFIGARGHAKPELRRGEI